MKRRNNNDEFRQFCVFMLAMLAMLFVSKACEAKGFVTHVTVTCYHAVAKECNSDPLTTADGTHISHSKVKAGTQRIASVSRDLLPYLPYGTVIEVEGHGRYTVHDTMHRRHKHRIDLLIHHSQKGFKEDKVKVKRVKSNKN